MSSESVYSTYFDTGRIVIPHLTMTAVTAVDSELKGISVQNSTGGTITLTVQDAQGTPRKIIDAVPIDPGQMYTFEWTNDEARMSAGVSWQASATGLYARMTGFKHAALTGIIRS